jgi:hypothetical protein
MISGWQGGVKHPFRANQRLLHIPQTFNTGVNSSDRYTYLTSWSSVQTLLPFLECLLSYVLCQHGKLFQSTTQTYSEKHHGKREQFRKL